MGKPKTTTSPQSPALDKPLPKGWRRVRFDEIAESVGERVEPGDADTRYYVGLEHLDTDSLRIRRWGTPDDVEATKLRFKAGDIIFGRRRVYQRKVGVAEFDGICSAHAMVVRAKEDAVEKDFLPFFMQSDLFMERALAISVGSLSPTINWSTLRRQEFPLPSKDEQRRIADMLQAAAKMIEQWRTVLAQTDQLLLAIREHEILSKLWPVVELAECLRDIVPGRSVVGVNEPALAGEYGVLKVSAVGADGFVPQENKRILNQEDFDASYIVRAGDVLMTRSNTPDLVGRVCIVASDYQTLMLCDKTLRLDFSEKAASAEFMLEALRTSSARRQIMALASGTGGAMKNISQDRIRRIRLPLPNGDEQRRLGRVVSGVYQAKGAALGHLAKAECLKKELREAVLTKGTGHA